MSTPHTCLAGLQKYDEYYQLEEELNDKLNIYAINFSASYGGFNDVKTQIGFPCSAGTYVFPCIADLHVKHVRKCTLHVQ